MDGGGARRSGPTRREVIAAAGASALALTAGTGLAAAAGGCERARVRGPRSARARREPGNRGIAGVMVSNGRDVVRTDAEGRWRLPVADGDSVFVIKPPHWSTPLGLGGVPQFSRLHQPTGSPRDIAYRHAGVAAHRPAAGRNRLPADAAGGERPLRGPAVRRYPARERHGARIPARRYRRRHARHQGRLRHQPRRHRVRRPLPLPALSADPERDGHPLAPLPRQPRHQFGGQGRPALARDMEARVRAAPLRLPARRRHVHRARQRALLRRTTPAHRAAAPTAA